MSAPVPLDTAPFTGTADVSSSGFIQFGVETTPGTPPGSFTWLPVLYAGTTWPQVAPDRQQIVVKGGSPNNVVAHLDRQSRVQMTLVAAMIPGADFTGFLAACGLHTDGTGFLKPLPTLTIVVFMLPSDCAIFVPPEPRAAFALVSSSVAKLAAA